MRGYNSWIYSADDGWSWSALFPHVTDKVRRVVPTSNPDVVLVHDDEVLFRFHISTSTRDTIFNDSVLVRGAQFTDGPLGVMVSTLKNAFLIGPDGTVSDASSGLPTHGAHNMLACSDGLLAFTEDGRFARLAGGSWSVIPLEYERLRTHGWHWYWTLRGERSVNDFWYINDPWLVHVRGDVAEMREVLLEPDNGVWVPEKGIQVILPFGGEANERRVVTWYASGPDETLFWLDSLTFFMPFSDSVFVMFDVSGTIYRTLPGNIREYEIRGELGARIEAGPYTTTVIKGRHAMLKKGNTYTITHDTGATWSALDTIRRIMTITATGNVLGVNYEGRGSEGDLVVEQLYHNEWTEVARLPREQFETRTSDIQDIAFNDVDQRLYIATSNWVRSVGLSVVSVHEDPVFNPQLGSQPHGVYDLLGRYICDTADEVSRPGLYIVVTESGTALRMF